MGYGCPQQGDINHCERRKGVRLLASRLDFRQGTQHAHQIPLRVRKHHPTGTLTINSPPISHNRRTNTDQPPYLGLLAPLARTHIKMDTLRWKHLIGNLDKQQPMPRFRIPNHALLIPRTIRIILKVHIPQHLLPPLGQAKSIVAINRGMRDKAGHTRWYAPRVVAWQEATTSSFTYTLEQCRTIPPTSNRSPSPTTG